MTWKRLSLVYLAGYLLLTGVAFLFAPGTSVRLLGSNATYQPVFVQFVGAFMIAVGAIVTQIIRFHLAQLYVTTVLVRCFFIVVILWLYHESADPLFLVILAVVTLGVCLTLTGFILDRRASLPPA
jgi:hypothetical protein